MAQVKFYRGEYANYNKATHKDGIFFAGDKHLIIMNGVEYGGVNMSQFEGFIKDVDVEGNLLKFKKDVNGAWEDVTITLLKAADNSIVVGDILKDGGVKDGSTIKVNVKPVGEAADGLKLGGDGLYVDLTKTTSSITANTQAIAKEKARAEAAEQANASAISKEVTDRKAAINALSASTKGGEGKFIQSVKEDKGIITAVEADLTAAAVAYNKTGDKVITSATNVSAAIKELDANVAANKDAELTYKTVKLTAEEVNALGDANVKEAYKVVSVNKEGTKTTVGDIIKIYKDSSLKSIDYVKENDKKKAGQFLKYVYTLENGTETTVYVDMSELVDQAEVEKGIQAVGGKLSIKLADNNEADFLTVDANGLKLSGVQAAINTAKNEVQGKLNAEINRAKAAEQANADAITVLNGTEEVEGSVAKSVADAKAELLGDAATEYNTLGKLEDKIQALDVKATKAHTEVVAKAEGHVRVAVADSSDKTHKVVTISENDIASATALTNEVNRAKAAEDKIEASVGLAADGSHVKTSGNYTKNATTVVGEIAALDTQVKANADAIAANADAIAANANTNLNLTKVGGVGKVITTVSQTNGQVSATAIDLVASAVTRTATADVTGKTVEAALSELATTIKAEASARKDADTTISGNVTTNTNAIATLNGEETAAGSVKHTAKTYVDEALNWIDAGTYGTEA